MQLGMNAATIGEVSAEYQGTSIAEVTNIMSPFKSEVHGLSNTLQRRIQLHEPQSNEEQKSSEVIDNSAEQPSRLQQLHNRVLEVNSRQNRSTALE